MQIRCSTCTKTIAIAPTGVLPAACPHCERSAVPKQLGAYVLDRLIATGGMGEVYLAHHDELGTEVAIKLLPALPLDVIDSVRQRFAREARLTAKVDHRGVVRVLSSNANEDRPYLVLELVTGKTLRQHAADRALPPDEAARIVAETADVLAAAHAHGVLHRDIKPDNVMLEPDGTVRVLDFGIARAIADDSPLTRTGEIVGTPEYMAPEQLLDGPEATDARTDVHALGVLLYELLTARSPFRSANVFQSLKLVESLVPKAPDSKYDLPPELVAVALRALEKQPDDRFQSAVELADALRKAVPCIREPRQPELRSKWPLRLGAGGVLLGVAALIVAIYFAQNGAGNSRSQTTDVQQSPLVIERIPTTAELQQQLDDGSWCTTLVHAQDALANGRDDARPVAHLAFVLTHAAWLRAAALPPWLAAYDLHRRERLFGDLLEQGDDADESMRELLAGDPAAWQQLVDATGDTALTQILELAELAVPARIASLQRLAQRLPIEQPEHWLALTIERHLRGDPQGAAHTAEMAWLTGAGELAVLLDAALALPSADSAARQQLWRRIAKADRDDCPASTLLLLHLQTRGTGNATFEPKMAHTFPEVHREAAATWFVEQADAATDQQRFLLLRIGVALSATPNFAIEPWSRVPANQHEQLMREHQRGK